MTVAPTFVVRIAALLIDYLVIVVWMSLIAAVSQVLTASIGGFNWLKWGTAVAQLLGFVVLVLPVGLYLFWGESSTRQATVGKRALGLQVVRASEGGRASRGQVLVRTIVKLLPWEVAHFAVWHIVALRAAGVTEWPGWLLAISILANLLPVGYVLTVALQRDRRGPHDLVAGTRVVATGGPR